MIDIRPGMSGDELPAITDVAQEDIDYYLDPNAKDVLELIPDPDSDERERLEGIIGDVDEVRAARAKVELAYTHLCFRDPFRARDLARDAGVVAERTGDALLLAKHHQALAQAYAFPEVEPQLVISNATDGEYLYHDLGKPHHEALMIWFRMLVAANRSSWSTAVGLVRDILGLLEDPDGSEHAFRCSVFSRLYLVLCWAAAIGGSSLDLLLQYAVLAIAHGREGNVPVIPGSVHWTVGGTLVNRGEHARGRAHLRRGLLVCQRTGNHNDAINTLCNLAQSYLIEQDFESADGLLREAETALQSIPGDTRYPVARVAAGRVRLAIEQGNLDEAEQLLRPIQWRFEKSWRANTIGLLELQIKIYRAKGTLHEHLDVYDRLVEEMKHSSHERAAAGLEAVGVQQKLREIEELRCVDSAFKALLPSPIYAEFRASRKAPARFYPGTAIFFSDFVGFTIISRGLSPRQVMEELTDLFTNFDRIMMAMRCERIETIGDAYVAVSGLRTEPEPGHDDSAVRLARAALDIQDYLGERNRRTDELGGPKFQARIGLHLGGIVGGVVGRRRIRFGIFGDAVNTTARLEAACRPGGICVSRELRDALEAAPEAAEFSLISGASVKAKGKGVLEVWYLNRGTVPSV